MSNRNKFRSALVIYFAILILLVLLSYLLDDGNLDKAWEALPEDDPLDHIVNFLSGYKILSFALVLMLFIILIASLIGLFLFKNWARWLTLWLTILFFPTSFFFGPSIIRGWEMAFYDTSNILFGAILASMFLAPISNEFNKSSKSVPKDGAI